MIGLTVTATLAYIFPLSTGMLIIFCADTIGNRASRATRIDLVRGHATRLQKSLVCSGCPTVASLMQYFGGLRVLLTHKRAPNHGFSHVSRRPRDFSALQCHDTAYYQGVLGSWEIYLSTSARAHRCKACAWAFEIVTADVPTIRWRCILSCAKTGLRTRFNIVERELSSLCLNLQLKRVNQVARRESFI